MKQQLQRRVGGGGGGWGGQRPPPLLSQAAPQLTILVAPTSLAFPRQLTGTPGKGVPEHCVGWEGGDLGGGSIWLGLRGGWRQCCHFGVREVGVGVKVKGGGAAGGSGEASSVGAHGPAPTSTPPCCILLLLLLLPKPSRAPPPRPSPHARSARCPFRRTFTRHTLGHSLSIAAQGVASFFSCPCGCCCGVGEEKRGGWEGGDG